MFRFNITQKFIAYLVLISILPLLVLGGIAFRNAAGSLQSEARRFTEQLVLNQRDYLELQLNQFESLLANIASVEAISQAFQLDKELDTFTYLNTQAQIGYILSGYINLEGLVSIDLFSTQGAHFHVGDTLDRDNLRADIQEQLYNAALIAAEPNLWAGVVENINADSAFHQVLPLVKIAYRTNPDTLAREPVGIFIVNHDVETLFQHFSRINFGENAYMMVVDQKGQIVYHPNRTYIGTPLVNPVWEILQSPQATVDEILVDEVEMTISYTTLSNGWKVASFIPMDNFDVLVTPIGSTIVIVLLGSFALVAATAYLFNQSVVKPVVALTERFKLSGRIPPELQTPLTTRSTDEIGELVRWFNTFLENLVIRQRAEAALLQRLQFEKSIAESASQLTSATAKNVDQAIQTTLHSISDVLKIDCAYVVLLPEHRAATKRKGYLWNIEQRTDITPLPIGTLPNLLQGLQELQIVQIPQVAKLDTSWAYEKQQLQERRVHSLMLIPLESESYLVGCLGFETWQTPFEGDTETLALLRLVAQIIQGTLERIANEEEREEIIGQLEETLHFRDRFIATMSHELRTPLNAIMGYSGLILQEASANDEIRYMNERVFANSERLLELINNVLDIARMNAGRTALEVHTIALPQLLQNWYDDFKTQANVKGIEFQLQITSPLPPEIQTDETRLTQIAANLLQNAFKFTEKGGQVTLQASANGSAWHFSVSDTGIGIPDNWRVMIFDEFRQVDSTSKRKYGGTGLGLSIVRKLCEIMGGQIEVQSELGKGSTFTVTMPQVVVREITTTPTN